MSRPEGADLGTRKSQAIVCLGSGVKLWNRLRRLVDNSDCPSDLILARSQLAAEHLVGLCRRLAPAILVVEDARLPQVPVEELADLVRSRQVQIIVLSDAINEASLGAFFRRGCAGVLSAEVTDEVLWKAIQAIFSGELWFPRKVLSRLAHEALFKTNPRRLTRRESDIYRLIYQGLTNQQIADELFISRETVRWHVRSLYSKIGVSSRAGAIEEAEHLGEEVSGKQTAKSEDEDQPG